MAVVPRKIKGAIVYRVAVRYKDKQYWEPAGNDRREAERLDARRAREVAQGTYVPPKARSGGITISGYAERFFAARTNRNAESEQSQVELHALSLEWFAGLRMEDARPHHFLRIVKELRAKTKVVGGEERRVLGEKSIANILGTIRTMFGDAHFNEVIPSNPYVLPRKTLKRRSKPRAPYRGREVLALLSDRVDVTRRVFLWLAFYTGMREGEICGRRWRDWIQDSRPLGALLCTSQYDDQPLKGDEADSGDTRPRVIPVHPELAATLDWWWREGWELVYGRLPTDDDFIFPTRALPERNHSRSSAYKLWRKACEEAGVTNHSLHSTRHTFTTFARRGTPRTDAVEAITHNKRGEMVDYYNHWLWTPICEAMLALSYSADALEQHPLMLAKARRGPGPAGTSGQPALPAASDESPPAASGAASDATSPGGATVTAIRPRELASCDSRLAAGNAWKISGPTIKMLPDPLPGSSNCSELLWRRRELNPGPRGIQSAFVHVRSRSNPCGGVRQIRLPA
jgi:integrase